jgi:hypothetical protein
VIPVGSSSESLMLEICITSPWYLLSPLLLCFEFIL